MEKKGNLWKRYKWLFVAVIAAFVIGNVCWWVAANANQENGEVFQGRVDEYDPLHVNWFSHKDGNAEYLSVEDDNVSQYSERITPSDTEDRLWDGVYGCNKNYGTYVFDTWGWKYSIKDFNLWYANKCKSDGDYYNNAIYMNYKTDCPSFDTSGERFHFYFDINYMDVRFWTPELWVTKQFDGSWIDKYDSDGKYDGVAFPLDDALVKEILEATDMPDIATAIANDRVIIKVNKFSAEWYENQDPDERKVFQGMELEGGHRIFERDQLEPICLNPPNEDSGWVKLWLARIGDDEYDYLNMAYSTWSRRYNGIYNFSDNGHKYHLTNLSMYYADFVGYAPFDPYDEEGWENEHPESFIFEYDTDTWDLDLNGEEIKITIGIDYYDEFGTHYSVPYEFSWRDKHDQTLNHDYVIFEFGSDTDNVVAQSIKLITGYDSISYAIRDHRVKVHIDKIELDTT